MKYTHYAPTARLCLVEGSDAFLLSLVQQSQAEGLKVGILTVEEKVESFTEQTKDVEILACGRGSELESVAHELFATLRKFDKTNVEVVFGHTFAEVILRKNEKKHRFSSIFIMRITFFFVLNRLALAKPS